VSVRLVKFTAPKPVEKLATRGPAREEANRTFRFTVSEGIEDRDGDLIHVDAWNLDNFLKNPIVLLHHDLSRPVARVSSIHTDGNRLVADITFPPEGTSRDSDEALQLVRAGVLRATSVRFLPRKGRPRENGHGIEYHEVELLEISLVTIPSNPAAVAASLGKIRVTPSSTSTSWAAPAPRLTSAQIKTLVPGLVRAAVHKAMVAAVAKRVQRASGRLPG